MRRFNFSVAERETLAMERYHHPDPVDSGMNYLVSFGYGDAGSVSQAGASPSQSSGL